MGIFSLAGAAGFTGGLKKAIDEDKDKMFKKIEARTKLYTEDALAARKTRRDRTALVRDQYTTATTMFGGEKYAGNLAESISKLPPEQFASFLKTYQEQKAQAATKGTSTDLASLGYIEPVMETITSDMVADPTGGRDVMTATSDITAKELAINVDDAVDRVMGKLDGGPVGVDRKEQETMRSALRKSFGSLSEEDITSQSERDAAANLNMSVENFRKLTSVEGIRGTSAAVPGVNIGAVIDPTMALARETAEAELGATQAETKGTIASTAGERAATVVRGEQAIALMNDNKLYLQDPSKPEGPNNLNLTFAQHNELADRRLRQIQAQALEAGDPLSDSTARAAAAALNNVATVIARDGELVQTNNIGVFNTVANASDITRLGIQFGEVLQAEIIPQINLQTGESSAQDTSSFKGTAWWNNTVNSSQHILNKLADTGDNPYKRLFASAKTDTVRDEVMERLQKAAGIKPPDTSGFVLLDNNLAAQLKNVRTSRKSNEEAVGRYINMNRKAGNPLTARVNDNNVADFRAEVLRRIGGNFTKAKVDEAVKAAYDAL